MDEVTISLSDIHCAVPDIELNEVDRAALARRVNDLVEREFLRFVPPVISEPVVWPPAKPRLWWQSPFFNYDQICS